MTHRELGNLIIKVDETFNNHLAGAAASALLCVFPGWINVRELS